MQTYTIGVLSLQGDFEEHIERIEQLGHHGREIRRASELDSIDALILPGGESTTIAILEGAESELSHTKGIFDKIRSLIVAGLPTWGTCMGSILLAKNIEGSTQGRLAVMDITVRRNAFGAQRWSVEREIAIPKLGSEPFPAVFIRAPIITTVGTGVEVLARIDEGIVMARQANMLATVFHPEVVDDFRVHEYFLKLLPRANTHVTSTTATQLD